MTTDYQLDEALRLIQDLTSVVKSLLKRVEELEDKVTVHEWIEEDMRKWDAKVKDVCNVLLR